MHFFYIIIKTKNWGQKIIYMYFIIFLSTYHNPTSVKVNVQQTLKQHDDIAAAKTSRNNKKKQRKKSLSLKFFFEREKTNHDSLPNSSLNLSTCAFITWVS